MTNKDFFAPKSLLLLAGFLIVVIGAGGLIGSMTAPGEWYAALDKPFFNPPNWIFAPVWTVLYIAIAIAGWRIWRIAPQSLVMKAWIAQLLLNWLWSPTFFTLQLLWPALIVILAVLTAIIIFMVMARHYDRLSAWLFAPYLAWVSFATLLNASVAYLN